MATQYYVDFVNNTDRTWTMCVYQELPDSVGLDSIAWKQTTVPHQGVSGVDWSITYNVAITKYKQQNGVGVYKATQTLDTSLGNAWDCVFKDGVQQLVPSTSTATVPAGEIVINNVSNLQADLAVGMSGQASVVKSNVLSGSNAQFKVTPTYWVGLFDDLLLGTVISSNVDVGPQEVDFPDGMNAATVTASLSGQTIVVNIAYSQRN